mmetsp:Transcript_43253/g.41621  ORF Transcript_43253/g.41621 Transcript_43253/m.41621 type:complete len:200 (-) Transcript_43253:310-909(-)
MHERDHSIEGAHLLIFVEFSAVLLVVGSGKHDADFALFGQIDILLLAHLDFPLLRLPIGSVHWVEGTPHRGPGLLVHDHLIRLFHVLSDHVTVRVFFLDGPHLRLLGPLEPPRRMPFSHGEPFEELLLSLIANLHLERYLIHPLKGLDGLFLGFTSPQLLGQSCHGMHGLHLPVFEPLLDALVHLVQELTPVVVQPVLL